MRTHITQLVIDNSRGTVDGANRENALRLIARLDLDMRGCDREFVPDLNQPFRNAVPEDMFGSGPVGNVYPPDAPVKIRLRRADQVGAGNALSNPRGEIVGSFSVPYLPSDLDGDRNGIIARNTNCHEVGWHGLGNGNGDYVYKQWAVRDQSGVFLPPQRDVWGFNSNDPFHSDPDHRDWDMGFGSGDMGNPNLRMDDLHRRIARGSYRLPTPAPPLDNNLFIIVRDRETRELIKPDGLSVFVLHQDINGQGFRVETFANLPHFKIEWALNLNVLYSEPLRWIKAYAPGYRPGCKIVSVGDAQMISLSGGAQMFVVEMDRIEGTTTHYSHPETNISGDALHKRFGGLIPGEWYVVPRFMPELNRHPQPCAGFTALASAIDWSEPNPIKDGTQPYYGTPIHLPHALLDSLPPGAPPPPPGPQRQQPERLVTCELCNPPPLRHITEATPAGPRRNV